MARTQPTGQDIKDGSLGAADSDGTLTKSSAFTAPSGITVGASPFVYQNSGSTPADVIVQGGTVSAVELTRDNVTFYSTGVVGGVFNLSPGDRLRVTYTVAPTMTLIPR